MIDFFRFWLILELLGIIALPLAWRMFRALPGRGLAFAKALGLLLTGYVLWLGASFGLLRNDLGGAIIAMLAVLAVGLWLARPGLQRDEEGQRPILTDLRDNWRYWLGVELLFLLMMAGWAYFRAYNPDIAGTEKPMEIAFINGVFNSPSFPPQDPWLAGFGISYYYFGYVLLGMLARLSGVTTTVVFNLGLASIFAFAVTEPFALVYDLVRSDKTPSASSMWAWIYDLRPVGGRLRGPDGQPGSAAGGVARQRTAFAGGPRFLRHQRHGHCARHRQLQPQRRGLVVVAGVARHPRLQPRPHRLARSHR